MIGGTEQLAAAALRDGGQIVVVARLLDGQWAVFNADQILVALIPGTAGLMRFLDNHFGVDR